MELDSILEIGEGWKPLVYKLYDNLILEGWDRELHQVKEKFGGLRFYIGNTSDKIKELIQQAEEESFTICEYCGEPGELNGKRWLKTTCDKHRG